MNAETDLRQELNILKNQLFELQRRISESAFAEEEIPKENCDILLCRVAGERVGLLLSHVREVVPVAAMARLPESPAWVAGLLNVRGTVMPVLDIQARIQRSARRLALSDLIVVGHDSGRPIGFVVQEVLGVAELDPASLQGTSADMPHGPYLLAAFRDPEGTVLLFSIRRLIATSDIPDDRVLAQEGSPSPNAEAPAAEEEREERDVNDEPEVDESWE